MDATRFKEAYARLELIDDRLTYKVRSKARPGVTAPSLESLDERYRDLAELTLELKDVMRELFLAIATK